ncbi:MAG: heparinase II/III family protein [Rhodobiaceae bacterium]
MIRKHRLALLIDMMTLAGRRFRQSLKSRFFLSVFGRGLWRGASGTIIFDYPPDLRPGNGERAVAWLDGDYTLPGGQMPAPGENPFQLAPPSARWQASLHGFDWLRHLADAEEDDARQRAARYIVGWIAMGGEKLRPAMAPEIVASRLAAWSRFLPQMRVLVKNDTLANVTASMARQAAWLDMTAPLAEDGLPRLQAALGLTLSGLIFDNGTERVRRGMDMLLREMKRQILPDGGHNSRAPDALMPLTADLLAIESGLAARNMPKPTYLKQTVANMQTQLVLMRHRDGRLACFNGGLEHTQGELAPLLPEGKRGQSVRYAQKSGYQRMQGGKTCVLVDVGQTGHGTESLNSHAAPLAFEMSHDRHRIIVNCGPNQVHGPNWHLASRGIAAHSVLGFDSDMDDPFLRHGAAARHLGARLKAAQWDVSMRRSEDKNGIWLDMGHGMFLASHGVRHSRRLFMTVTGDDIRGEDLLMPGMGSTPSIDAPFHLRFHLHPEVSAGLQRNGGSILLVTPGGHGWQFRAAGEAPIDIGLEDSVYMGRYGRPQRSRQITISASLGKADTLVRWALRYSGRMSRRRKGG